MLARKKVSENVDPKRREIISKKGVTDVPEKRIQTKTKKPATTQTRRAAFGDITNAKTEQSNEDEKKPVHARGNINKPLGKSVIPRAKKPGTKLGVSANVSEGSGVSLSSSSSSSDLVSSSQESSFSSNERILRNLSAGLPADRVEEDFSFVVTDDSVPDVGTGSDKSEAESEKSLLSVDQELYTDVFNVGIYAQHIFDYYKRREKMFAIPDYMGSKHCHITPLMRAILVDWMVEIQEYFELNHETLYLAVKLVDIYLSRNPAKKETLQLIGAVSAFIASKFDERCPPLIEDFIFISENAFDRGQFITMEMEILKTVEFDLGIPISYRFLRRYAKVARMSLETLTLARYILETSLMEYDLVTARDSMTAAAALYIAQKMRKEGSWEGEVVKSCGYSVEDIKDLVVRLNTMLHAQSASKLSTVRSKYSHEIFHQVAKLGPLPTRELL